MLHFTNYH